MNGIRIFRLIVVTIYMVALVWVTGMAIGMAAQRGYLIAVAVPLPLIPILGLSILRRTEQRAGWVLFTIWLGSTYAATGVPSELAVFGVISLLGIAAFWSSPWLFPLAWFGHIAWDFMPRQLPEMLIDLPTACMIFDGIIGAWLAWRAYTGWWKQSAEA